LPALSGDYFPLASPETGRTYHIYIRYPEDYASHPARRYPIVYLLDGDSAFPLLAPEHLFIHYDDKLPDALIVGIAYGSFDPSVNRRHFDFSPPSGKPDEGGAPAFERFLRDRLIPAVEQRTRADPTRRVLVGQSRGGGFVFYSAFTDPDLFWARIASSPTLRPGQAIYFADPAPAHRTDLRFVVADGTDDYPEIRPDVVAWEKAWQHRTGPWRLKVFTVDGGTHSADLPNVYRKAMNWLFSAPAP
jgi:predicted alpha/beta superfamily hydrolase